MIDTLIDTSPLVSILNRGDSRHSECVSLLRSLRTPFHSTLPVMTEAMYLCERHLGWKAQEALWKMLLRGDLLLHHPSSQELERMAELMEKYKDRPMDFADASLVALAETLSLNRIFTLDYNDFSTYRMKGNRPFTIVGARPPE